MQKINPTILKRNSGLVLLNNNTNDVRSLSTLYKYLKHMRVWDTNAWTWGLLLPYTFQLNSMETRTISLFSNAVCQVSARYSLFWHLSMNPVKFQVFRSFSNYNLYDIGQTRTVYWLTANCSRPNNIYPGIDIIKLSLNRTEQNYSNYNLYPCINEFIRRLQLWRMKM